jgi:hypothetical protein
VAWDRGGDGGDWEMCSGAAVAGIGIMDVLDRSRGGLKLVNNNNNNSNNTYYNNNLEGIIIIICNHSTRCSRRRRMCEYGCSSVSIIGPPLWLLLAQKLTPWSLCVV